ncbi:MAG: polysaccharide biosynthesis/export family protein [Verrucomicrobiota bacterium]|nr:polysaccharide biosynthesis/export family protein [Verrucomicrobiota bacterium]
MCLQFIKQILVRSFLSAAFTIAVVAQAQSNPDYQIAAQDLLIIDVVGEKDLSGKECRVSSSGTIVFPYLGSVEVKGKTVTEVTALLRELLDKDYLVEPEVMVTVKDYRTREITVMGPVNKPGSVVLPGEQKITIVDAIGRAGGLTKFANKDKIKFTRDGRTETFSFDTLKKTATDPQKVIYLQPGDIIEVAENIF